MAYVLILHICWGASCSTVVLPEVYVDIDACSKIALTGWHSGTGVTTDWQCRQVR